MTLRNIQFPLFLTLSLAAIMSLAGGVSSLVGPTTIAPLVEEVKSSVVNIAATQSGENNGMFRQPRERTAIGSGVIIDADNGYIVTNEHVIRAADKIVVTLDDGRSMNAVLVGDDYDSDIAVLQISSDNLKALELADSDAVRVGDFVLAIGNPYRLHQTVTSGIVSGLERKETAIENVAAFIQTDAAINEGNSGGPLISFSGEVIGINTAILGRSGIGFAIPSNLVAEVFDRLVEFGDITRPFLGIIMETLSQAERYTEMYNLEENLSGVEIIAVVPRTPADEAGLKRYDIITTFNGESVSSIRQLSSQIKLATIGEEVPIEIFRGGEFLTLSVTVRPDSGARIDVSLRGSTIRQINRGDPYFNAMYQRDGYVVQKIEPDSPASNLDLKVGDVILSGSPSIDVATGEKTLGIYREGEVLFITLPLN